MDIIKSEVTHVTLGIEPSDIDPIALSDGDVQFVLSNESNNSPFNLIIRETLVIKDDNSNYDRVIRVGSTTDRYHVKVDWKKENKSFISTTVETSEKENLVNIINSIILMINIA